MIDLSRSRLRYLALFLALLLATFEMEPFEDEYEDSHGSAAPSVPSYNVPPSTWETCDKDSAPRAFTYTAIVVLACVTVVPPELPVAPHSQASPAPVRDKSPPLV